MFYTCYGWFFQSAPEALKICIVSPGRVENLDQLRRIRLVFTETPGSSFFSELTWTRVQGVQVVTWTQYITGWDGDLDARPDNQIKFNYFTILSTTFSDKKS